MAKNLKTPLTETEIEALDAFMATRQGPVRSFEGLDGLICALICAPVPPNHDEYLTLVVGDEGFDSQSQASGVQEMVRRHYETTAHGIAQSFQDQAVYPPALMVDDEGLAMGNEWSLGFLLGVSMTESHWAEFTKNDELGRLIVPMMVLAHEHHPDPQMRPSEINDEGREDLLNLMATSLMLIYGHFHAK